MNADRPIDRHPARARRRRLRPLRWLLFALLALPPTAWALVKPVRLLAPQWQGLVCADSVCSDDEQRLPQALALYDAALIEVGARLGALQGRPRMVFCATRDCYASFGGGAERAITYPYAGSLLAPDSWAPHFARHELIHVAQTQRLGALRMLSAPNWWREGMAYSVSAPPPYDMPAQFVAWRDQYEAWAATRTPATLWPAAGEL